MQQTVSKINLNQLFLFAALVVALLLIDQISKALVRGNLDLGEYIPLLGQYLGIGYTQNTGAAFGIFTNGTVPLSILAVIMAIACLCIFFKPHLIPQLNNTAGRLSISLLFVGAIGNMLDRLLLGFVTDWIKLPPIPNFNVADSCITIAVLIIIIFIFLPIIFKKEKRV